MDEVIALYGVPDFAKIDVEGYELHVLRGLSQPIKIISIEYAVPEGLNLLSKCIDRVMELSCGNMVKFNYSKEESMEWGLNKWLTEEAFRKEMKKESFVNSKFGDIYITTQF